MHLNWASRAVLRLGLGLLLLAVWGCGDDAYGVLIRNGAEVRVDVSFGDDVTPLHLAPGEDRYSQWRVPGSARDARLRTVTAKEPGGSEIFCHRYSYAEVRDAHFEITIRRDRRDCG
jgi:hypothetical protein